MSEPSGSVNQTHPLEATDRGLSSVRFPNRAGPYAPRSPDNPTLSQAKRELTAYFAGGLKRFSVPLDWQGTDFQQSVWEALTHIPYGETVSYADIARAIGRPKSARPTGGAVGANPLPIIVPCHGIMGSDRSLTGFTGGLVIKIRLLVLEGHSIN